VGLYPDSELIAKAKYELELLYEYMVTEEDYDEIYYEWKERIEKAVEKIEDERKKDEKDTVEGGKEHDKLRAELRSLREKIAWYDKTWAEGEVIIKGVSYWTTVSVIAIMLVGLLPIIHPEGSKVLGILHWGALGWAGALLSVLLVISKMDVTEVGEQEGKQILLKAAVGISIGVMTAILLYAALSGGIISGKIFPEVPVKSLDKSKEGVFWVNTGLSIFWSIFAGFSLRIFYSLTGLANSAFGKE
jgi:hypothetical protein